MVDAVNTLSVDDPNSPSTGEADPLADFLIKMQSTLKSEGYNFDVLYEELAEYIIPHKVGFITSRSKGEKQTSKLFDSTAVVASTTLASTLHGALTSAATQWFNLRTANRDIADQKEVKDWIDSVVTIMVQHINDSNFDPEVDEGYLDLTVFGLMGLWHGDRDGGSHFQALHLSNFWFTENMYGEPDAFFSLKKVSSRDAVNRWGKTGKLSDKYASDLLKTPHKEHDFLHVIYPRDVKKIPVGKRRPAKKRPFAEYWVDLKSKQIVEEDGYYEFPVYIPRWAKTTGESRGRSVGMNALPDIKTLNKAKELGLKAWAKVIDPPLKRKHAGIISKVRSVAGGITDVRNMESLKPLYDSNAFRFDVSQLKQQELKQSINEAFFIDQLRLPPVPDSKTMSATEAQIRYEQMEKVIAPTLGRIKRGLLSPLIKRVFAMLMRAGELPDPPKDLSQIDIEYVSPFETAQKMSEIAGIQRFVADVMGIANAKPEALDRLDADGLVDILHEKHGIPPKILVSKRDAEKTRQARQKQEAEMQKMAIATQMSQMAKNLPEGE